MSRSASSRFVLNRRTMLRGSLGAGVACVGLPLLDAMLNSNGTALAGGAALPRQFITYFIGNGFRLDQFEPSQTGASFALTPELIPLAAVEPYVKVVTGLQNWCYAQPTHHEGMTQFNGYHFAEWDFGLTSKAGGPTIDQVVADHIEASFDPAPLVRSIEVGISRKWSEMDGGTTLYAVAHRAANEPLDPEFNPQTVWQTLFSEFSAGPDDSELRLLIIDSIRDDARKLQARVGKIDKERLEAHLDGIAELEQRIKAAPPACTPPALPTETNPPGTFNEPLTSVNEIMCDLLVHALKCDITRVGSVFFIGGAAETVYTEIGQGSGHHANTHNGGAQGEVHNGVVYSMERVAYLLEKMQSTVDATGQNLLDTGLVMVGSDCSEGIDHSVSRQPFVLAGNLRDALVGKYHYQATPKSGPSNALAATGNTSDVLFTILKAFNPAATSVGDMTPRSRVGGGWYGSSGAPNQVVAGSDQIISELTGPAFG